MKSILKNKLTLTLIGVLIVTTISAIALTSYYFFNQPKGIEVTNFVNMQVHDVMSWKDTNKLSDDQVIYIYEYSETIPLDTVISQSVDSSELIKKDDTITFVISKGFNPELVVTIPDFTNKTKDEIQTFFSENKFTDVTYEYEVHKTIKKDFYIKSNLTGTEAKRNDLILITLSIGATNTGVEITMPDFKDQTKANVQAWASTNNISVTFKEETSTTVEKGKVISQSINAGDKILTGSKCTIIVSSGEPVSLIDLTGKTKDEVDKWAKENSVKVDYYSYYADSTAKDKVISTSPKSGNITASTTVKVYMSLGSVVVPDFTDKKEADVKTWIETTNKSIYDKANYITYTLVQDTTSTKAAGVIVKTSPAKTETVKLKGNIAVSVATAKLVTVTDQKGKSVADFTTYITGLNLKLGAKSEVYNDLASGLIVRNDTGSKTEGTLINYVTSKGPYNPSNTEFENKTVSEAQGIISTANALEAGWQQLVKGNKVWHDTIASGNTVSCSISGKTVTCTVSKGKGVTVKKYIGSQNPCGGSSCSIDGLNVTVETEANYSSVPLGQVTAQSVAEGTTVANGSSIKLTVSRGPEQITDITLNEYDLKSWNKTTSAESGKTAFETGLTNMGFSNIEVTIQSGCNIDSIPAGTYIKELSSAPKTYKSNEKITIVISSGACD